MRFTSHFNGKTAELKGSDSCIYKNSFTCFLVCFSKPQPVRVNTTWTKTRRTLKDLT